jgi:Holliday junction resolvasome RuvABC ATP-dependent DNA helicase subunit
MINQEYVDSFFPDIIGQDKVKRQLAFYINSFRSTQILPHLLVIGGKGSGKTALATLVARNLKVKDLGGLIKPMIKVNCATVRKLDSLVENVFIPYVKDHCTIFFDECHALDPIAQEALLTALNPDRNMIGYINYKDSVLEFPFNKISFIFATTDPQKLGNPLKDRLRTIQLEPYTQDNLAQIIKVNIPNIKVEDDALYEASLTCRGNPRASVKMAQENIMQYCAAAGLDTFTMEEWGKMKELLGINDLGVAESELQILKALEGFEGRSLNALAAATGLEKSSIMGEFESYLMRMGLLEVAAKGRKLTYKGAKYLDKLKEAEAANK